VIEVVELGRRSGLLSVERNAGTVLEEGVVYFISGRPVFAALGSLRGRDALRALSRWAECRFAFDPDVPPPAPNVSAPIPSVEMPTGPQRALRRQTASSGPGSSDYSMPNSSSWSTGSGASSGIWNTGSRPPQPERHP